MRSEIIGNYINFSLLALPFSTTVAFSSSIRHAENCPGMSIRNIIYGMDTTGEKENRTSKTNVDRRSTSRHDNKKFRTRSVEKQRGMAFGFRKTVTVVIKPDR